MTPVRTRWGRALGAALIAEVAQVAAAFGWVAIYSYLINPGQVLAVYQEYAQRSGSWVSLIAGTPIFWLVARYLAGSRLTARAMFGLFALIDGAILVASAGDGLPVSLWMVAASYGLKFLACELGGRSAEAGNLAST